MRPVRITAYSWALGDGCPRAATKTGVRSHTEKRQSKSPTKKNRRIPGRGLSAAQPARTLASTVTDLSKSDIGLTESGRSPQPAQGRGTKPLAKGRSESKRSIVRSGRLFDPRPALRARVRSHCACEAAGRITPVVGLRGSRTDGDVLVAGELPRRRFRCRRAYCCRSVSDSRTVSDQRFCETRDETLRYRCIRYSARCLPRFFARTPTSSRALLTE
jgi:hypothetical protein